MEEGYVNCTRENDISTIEFYHPLSNSMPGTLLRQLTETLQKESESETKVIIIKSAGEKAFCAGANFGELMAVNNEEQGLEFFSGFAHVINAMRLNKKLIIARVQGKCVGGGVGIASAADYTIATNEASIKLSELALGIGPFVIGPSVVRKIGQGAYSELAIDASSWRSAQWAGEKGLFNEVYSTIEEVDKAVQRLAGTLSQYNPEAMTEMKKVFWEGTDNWEPVLKERAAISGRLVMSTYTRNAIQKFKKK
ncbi:MAG: enoyl-CoA hydratase/isomerase family protein [Chitinophagaceae bacterium]|nr:enoyl-CoA hydratase/isomerase family protein [Chitinophagaceae bacterium]